MEASFDGNLHPLADQLRSYLRRLSTDWLPEFA